jgi:hypothetical protein
MDQQQVNIKNNMDINEAIFPAVQEGDRILWSDDKWYIYTSGQWIEEEN